VKTTVAGPYLVPQKRGGALKSGGTPGNKGGGRPKKEWTQFCRELVEDPQVQERMLMTARSNERSQIGAVQLIVQSTACEFAVALSRPNPALTDCVCDGTMAGFGLVVAPHP
jgi:hypothetical protein